MPLRELIEMFDKRKGKIAGIVAEPVGYLPPGYEHMSGPDGPSPLGTPEGDLHFQPSRDPAAAAAEAVKAAGLGGGSNSGSAWNPEERNGGGRGGGQGRRWWWWWRWARRFWRLGGRCGAWSRGR